MKPTYILVIAPRVDPSERLVYSIHSEGIETLDKAIARRHLIITGGNYEEVLIYPSTNFGRATLDLLNKATTPLEEEEYASRTPNAEYLEADEEIRQADIEARKQTGQPTADPFADLYSFATATATTSPSEGDL